MIGFVSIVQAHRRSRRYAYSAMFFMPVLVPTGTAPIVSPLIKQPQVQVITRACVKRQATWQLSGGVLETTKKGKTQWITLSTDRRHRRPGSIQFTAQRKGLTDLPAGIQRRGTIRTVLRNVDAWQNQRGDVQWMLQKKALPTSPALERRGKIVAYTQAALLSRRTHKEWLRFARWDQARGNLAPPPPLVHKAQIFGAPGSQYRLIDQTNDAVGRTRLVKLRHKGHTVWLAGRTSLPAVVSLPGAVCTMIVPETIGNTATISISGDICTIATGVAS